MCRNSLRHLSVYWQVLEWLTNFHDEIRRGHILQQFFLEEPCSLCRVSKGWKSQIEQDAPYVPQLIQWLSPLDHVINIESSQRFKKYQEILAKMTKLQIKKHFLLFSEKRTEHELFGKAIKSGDYDLAHRLIKSGHVSVNRWIEENPISTSTYSKLFTYPSYNVIFYLWKFTNYYNLAKLLLLHGADPTLPNYERTYYCHLTSRELREEKAIAVSYSSTERHLSSAMKILSLIYIRYTERCFQDKQPLGSAINYLKQSVEPSTEVAQEYIAKVIQTKQGFVVNYSDDQINCITQTLSALSALSLATAKHQESKQNSCSLF